MCVQLKWDAPLQDYFCSKPPAANNPCGTSSNMWVWQEGTSLSQQSQQQAQAACRLNQGLLLHCECTQISNIEYEDILSVWGSAAVRRIAKLSACPTSQKACITAWSILFKSEQACTSVLRVVWTAASHTQQQQSRLTASEQSDRSSSSAAESESAHGHYSNN